MKQLFKPIQPEWNGKLSYITTLECTSQFKSSISFVYQFEILSTDEQEILLPGIPDGCIDLIFNLHGDQKDCYLVPSPKARHYLSFKTNTLYFGIRLLPLQSAFSFDIALGEINLYKRIPLFEINKKFLLLFEQLMCVNTLDERLQAVENFLYHTTKEYSTPSNIVSACIDYALCTNGNLYVKELESLTGYSDRYLRKLFQQEIGMSPKTLLEMIYFQFTIQEMLKGDFSIEKHLSKNDLYDASHFYKKFKRLTNMTPIEYQKLIST